MSTEAQPISADLQLSKVVANLMPCSRSKAEQYIAQGWVRVDGQLVQEPQRRIAPGQRVEVDPQARLVPVLPVTMLLHKPAGLDGAQAQACIADATRWAGDTSGVRHLAAHRQHLAAPLPLPDFAGGLVVFTQEPRVLRKLVEEAALVEQELNADVEGSIAPDGLARMARGGLVVAGRPLPPTRVSWQSEARLRFAVKGIAPEWIAPLCAQVGLTVTALRRIRIGRVAMAGLPPGQWRYLRPDERF